MKVETIDEFFLATQYDFDWREDLKNFSVSAQCLNLQREGYKSVVIQQKKPCAWVRKDNFQIDAQAQKIFLEDYKYIYPLITVTIPTFNRPKYFQEALESVLNQTYRNFEIVVSDDGTNDETENLIQPYLQKYSCIKYFRHKGVQFLMDDDRILPRKFEVMVEVFRTHPKVSLVTSTRRHVDAEGKFTGDNSHLLNLKADAEIDGQDAGKLLFIIDDYIGMPSNVLMKKSCLRNNDLCWHEDEKGFFSLIDVSTWCQLLSKGNLYWCVEYLSDARIHDGEAGSWEYTPFLTSINYAKLLKSAWDRKIFLKTETDVRRALYYWLQLAASRLRFAVENNLSANEVKSLEKTFIAMTKALENGYKIELPPVEYSKQDDFNKMT